MADLFRKIKVAKKGEAEEESDYDLSSGSEGSFHADDRVEDNFFDDIFTSIQKKTQTVADADLRQMKNNIIESTKLNLKGKSTSTAQKVQKVSKITGLDKKFKDLEQKTKQREKKEQMEQEQKQKSSDKNFKENEVQEEWQDDVNEGEEQKFDNKMALVAPDDERDADEIQEEQERMKIFQKIKIKEKTKKTTWDQLGLMKPLLKAVGELNYPYPTHIQSLTIPAILSGRDVLASSSTGTGKTAAFLLPILQRYYNSSQFSSNYSQVLIVTPTRELSFQCLEMFHNLNLFTKTRATLVIGAMSIEKQEVELRSYPQIIVGTPGRIIDHLRNSKSFDIENLEVLIFDEADKLLEMGFQGEVNQILNHASNPNRQTLLFSATLNSSVKKLINLALKKPIRIQANKDGSLAERLSQQIVVIEKDFKKNEEDALNQMREAYLVTLIQTLFTQKSIIFFRTKKQCHRMAVIFEFLGHKVCELHGNLSQHQRMQAFQNFKEGKFELLLATDLAARGLDIKDLKAVINFELPAEATRYIHRVGRTARAGKHGVCVTICTDGEKLKLKKMLKQTKEKVQRLMINKKKVNLFLEKIGSLQEELDKVSEQETVERQIRKAQIEAKRAENMINFKDEIFFKPKKTWFQSQQDKKRVQEQYQEMMNPDMNQYQQKPHKKFKKN